MIIINDFDIFKNIHSGSISSQTSNLVPYDQTNHRKIMKLIYDKAIQLLILVMEKIGYFITR